MRTPLISLALCLSSLGAAAVACSAPDPGVGYLGLSHPNGGGGSSTTGGQDSGSPVAPATGGSSSGATTPPTGSGSGSGGGVKPVVDAGGGGGAVDSGGGGGNDAGTSGTASTFLGEATPWASNSPAQTAKEHHAAVGQAPQTSGTPCLGCHVTGGSGAPFLAAGFVATSAGGTTGASDVEVRVYAQGGTAAGYSAHTDTDGFFWINPPVGGTTGPYQAGARDGTTTQLMPAAQTAADCQSCHAGATGVIHLP